MKKQNTHPGITQMIIANLRAWRLGTTAEPITSHQVFGLQEATRNQNSIGWQALLEGCPALGWKEAQQAYYEWLPSKRTGLRWLSALVRKLWQIAWDMWEHRNGILHDKEKGQAAQEREARIRAEFEEGFDDLDVDTQLLAKPGLRRILRYKAGPQKSWIARIEAAQA